MCLIHITVVCDTVSSESRFYECKKGQCLPGLKTTLFKTDLLLKFGGH